MESEAPLPSSPVRFAFSSFSRCFLAFCRCLFFADFDSPVLYAERPRSLSFFLPFRHGTCISSVEGGAASVASSRPSSSVKTLLHSVPLGTLSFLAGIFLCSPTRASKGIKMTATSDSDLDLAMNQSTSLWCPLALSEKSQTSTRHFDERRDRKTNTANLSKTRGIENSFRLCRWCCTFDKEIGLAPSSTQLPFSTA